MARVDSRNDEIKRYVVRLYAFDPTRHERRHREIGTYDDWAEAMRSFGATHAALLDRRNAGIADEREHVTMVVKEPGDDERSRRRRIEEKRRRSLL